MNFHTLEMDNILFCHENDSSKSIIKKELDPARFLKIHLYLQQILPGYPVDTTGGFHNLLKIRGIIFKKVCTTFA